MRYVTRALFAAIDSAGEFVATANEVHEPEPDPQRTGLLDQYGNPLYRVVERHKMGFEV